MGYIPHFENDIFISYRHVANDDHVNWVDMFRERLGAARTHRSTASFR